MGPAGCCPEVNWYCCPDDLYCAATAADCRFVAKKAQLVKMAAKKQCDGTECPAGCCPEVNWYCCPDNLYCAATAADCPFVYAQMDAAQKSTGTVALTTSTVLPLLLTVPLSMPRWMLPRSQLVLLP